VNLHGHDAAVDPFEHCTVHRREHFDDLLGPETGGADRSVVRRS
jgi:hypothetical protein